MRLIARWFLNALALLIVAYIFKDHGISITGVWAALKAALFLGIVNALIRPVVILLTLPLNILTLGLFTLVINAAFFGLTAWFIDGFEVTSFWAALFGAILLSIVSAVLSYLVRKIED
jgi:putative membrane protein